MTRSPFCWAQEGFTEAPCDLLRHVNSDIFVFAFGLRQVRGLGTKDRELNKMDGSSLLLSGRPCDLRAWTHRGMKPGADYHGKIYRVNKKSTVCVSKWNRTFSYYKTSGDNKCFRTTWQVSLNHSPCLGQWLVSCWGGNRSPSQSLVDILGMIKVPPCLELQPRWSRPLSAADCLCSLQQLFHSSLTPAWTAQNLRGNLYNFCWSGL